MFVLRKKLQRHLSAQLGVRSLIHNAHASAAQLAENPVVPNRLSVHSFGKIFGSSMVAAGPSPVNSFATPKGLNVAPRPSARHSPVRSAAVHPLRSRGTSERNRSRPCHSKCHLNEIC